MSIMSETGYMSDSFGEWSNLQERIEELRNRMAAWFICGLSMSELFEMAGERFEAELRANRNPLDVPAVTLLKIFEDILDAHDNMLEIAPFETDEGDV